MDERNMVETDQPLALQEWVTPELIVEDVKDVTFGGTGDEVVFGGEDQISNYYHS